MEFNHHAELIALSKALNFIKFRCHDSDCSHLAGSPYIGDLFKNVLIELEPYYKKSNIEANVTDIYIDDDAQALDAIRYHITNVSSWNEIANEQKKSVLKEYIKPFKFTKNTIKVLLDYGNNYHSANEGRPNHVIKCNAVFTHYENLIKDDPEVFLWNDVTGKKISAFMELDGRVIQGGNHTISLDSLVYTSDAEFFVDGAKFKVDYKGTTIGEVSITNNLN